MSPASNCRSLLSLQKCSPRSFLRTAASDAACSICEPASGTRYHQISTRTLAIRTGLRCLFLNLRALADVVPANSCCRVDAPTMAAVDAQSHGASSAAKPPPLGLEDELGIELVSRALGPDCSCTPPCPSVFCSFRHPLSSSTPPHAAALAFVAIHPKVFRTERRPRSARQGAAHLRTDACSETPSSVFTDDPCEAALCVADQESLAPALISPPPFAGE